VDDVMNHKNLRTLCFALAGIAVAVSAVAYAGFSLGSSEDVEVLQNPPQGTAGTDAVSRPTIVSPPAAPEPRIMSPAAVPTPPLRCDSSDDDYFDQLDAAEQERVREYWETPAQQRWDTALEVFEQRRAVASELPQRTYDALTIPKPGGVPAAVEDAVMVIEGTVASLALHRPWAVLTVVADVVHKGSITPGQRVDILMAWWVEYWPGVPPECELVIMHPAGEPVAFHGFKVLLFIEAAAGADSAGWEAGYWPSPGRGFHVVLDDGQIVTSWAELSGRTIDEARGLIEASTD
jgi:hypothetical protein